jgi:hypothetical protein
MVSTSFEPSAEHADLAGFWRRIFSVFIDMALISVIFQIMGIVAFGLSEGRIQSSAAAVSATRCEDAAAPPGFAVDPRFERRITCRNSLLGQTFSQIFIASHVEKQGNVVVSQSVAVRVDDHGRTGVIDIGNASWVVLYSFKILLQRRGGRTPGDRAAGVRIVGRTSVAALTARYALQAAPGLAGAGVILLATAAGAPLTATIAISGVGLAVYLWALVDILRRRPPYFDRLSGAWAAKARKAAGSPAAGDQTPTG